MDSLNGLLLGFESVLQPENLLAAFIGVFVGTCVGVLPGLGPIGAAGVLFPLTYTLNPVAGLIMIAGIYYGAMYGGSTTAILLKIPGEASSVVTALDGYEMTRKGRGGAALGIAALGSCLAGTLVVVLAAFFTPWLSRVGLAFAQPELFAITAGGLILMSTIVGKGGVRSVLPMLWGVALATIGQEAITGANRFTFGELELTDGIGVVPMALGMFGLAELMVMAQSVHSRPEVRKMRMRELLPTHAETRRSMPSIGRGSVIGFVLGLLPGPSTVISSFLSYKVESKVSKYRHELGTGAPEGVAGPESANNAAASSSVIPILGLGIPFSVTLAFMLSAMTAQGITPGPLLINQHPEVFWGIIASMYIGNIMLVILNVPMIGIWVKMLQIPYAVLIPSILLIATYGVYAFRLSMWDLYFALAFAVIAYVLRIAGFELAPFLLGLILGPLVEKYFRQGLVVGDGELLYFLSSPITIIVWSSVGLAVVAGIVARNRARRTRGAATTVELLAAAKD